MTRAELRAHRIERIAEEIRSDRAARENDTCRCGHSRGAHMDDVASCCSCRNCFSFRKEEQHG